MVEDKIILKDTRWDKIARRHFKIPQSTKTETVKRIEGIDFIGDKNFKALNGDVPDEVDPALLIKLRHEMIKRPSKKEPSISVSSLLRMEKVKEHNQVVEDHYIGNELTKLRSQLQKQRLVEKVKPPKVNLDPDMTEIIRSAASSASSVRDFYTAPIDALQHMETSVGLMDVKTIQNIIVPSIRNEDEESMSSYFSEKHLEITVHFEENMEDNSSETSSRTPKEHEIDSAISYLADKVIDQIEAEAKLELVEEKFQQLKLTGTHIREDPDESLKITKLEKEEVPEAKNDGEDDSDECVSSTSETNSLVQKLFIQRFPPDGILLKKYFLKWIHYTTIQKIEKENISSNPSQISKINSFLDKIRHEKSRIAREKPITQGNENRMENVVMTKKYRNKIKVQQDIIDFQKIKLERQERLIMELKLNRLSEEAKEAKMEIKKELKAAMRSTDVRTRFKAKCLQVAGHLKDEEDDELARLQGKSLLMPKFLIKMQERAQERSEKHEQAKQRRIALEAEREAAKIAAEEAKRLEDEQAKQARIEALKEKRRQEKLAKINKEKERLKFIEDSKKAFDFNRRRLLRRYGFSVFRKLIEVKRKNARKCELLKRKFYKKRFFGLWRGHCEKVKQEKNEKADRLYHHILKRNSLEMWFRYINYERSKFRVACDWYDAKLAERVLVNWGEYTRIQKLIEEAKMKQAEMHHEWHLKWKVIDRWQRLPQMLQLEKETEERRQRWRLKIWELLPDYNPVQDPYA